MDELCSSCGVAVEPDQEYCLECGARLERPRRRGRAPAWIWASLGALAIAAGGAAAAIAATRDGGDGGGGSRTIVALSRLRPAPSPVRATATKPRVATAGKGRRSLITWPATTGYTIVLASIPVKRGIGPAKAIAQRALRRGLRNVGVLVSTSYAGLHPGYYIVFTGVYGSVEEAQGQLPGVTARFPTAYARQIAR